MKYLNKYNQINENTWIQIDNEYEEDGEIYIDAWLTEDENENGHTIAKIDILTDEVTYYDQRAKTDTYAQEMIKDAIDNIDPETKIELRAKKYNL